MEMRSGGLILDTSSFVASSTPNPRIPDEMDFFSVSDDKTKSQSCRDSDLKVPSICHNDHHHHPTVNTGLHLLTTSGGSDRSTGDDGGSSHDNGEEDRELSEMRAELRKLNEENQRLKNLLNQSTANYNALHIQYISLMQQVKSQRNINSSLPRQELDETKKQSVVARQFMDLGLASMALDNDDVEEANNSSMDGGNQQRERSISPIELEQFSNKGNIIRKDFVLPFDRFSSKSQIGNQEEDQSAEHTTSQGWIPNKALKLSNAATCSNSHDQAQEATMRKARVSVRARSEAPMITDGCQWRKYGQKMAKGNPCPRAYYRCTMAAGCPVRKQVQRCADDRTILITTYEGNHNHPLPPAAVAMASTTSAAATMLLSGSMSTADTIMNPNFLAKTILPCSSSLATISASAPFPTVTLDLTQTPNTNPANLFQSPAAQFQLGNFQSNFSTPQIFGQSLTSSNSQSKFSGLQMSGASLEAGEQKPPLILSDTVSAATAAITADPTFTAALAAAITSIIGNSGGATGGSSDIQRAGNNSSSSIISDSKRESI